MQKNVCSILLLAVCTLSSKLSAQTTPPDPEAWPPTIDTAKTVHYVSVDDAFAAPGQNWMAATLQILTGGDQVTQPITIGGHTGVKVSGNYLNIADSEWTFWADEDTIDILMQVFGDSAVLNSSGEPRNFQFLEGTLPDSNLSSPSGGSLPKEAKNQKWNWVLFRIPNGTRSIDGMRYVGSLAPNATGGTAFGGVNGGTLRAQSVNGLQVRLIAFGQQGAFGEPEQINVFQAAEACAAEPATGSVYVDLNAGVSNHLSVLNNLDQTVTYQDNVGPAGDTRRAVKVTGTYMNFGILDNYLGQACNEPRPMKLCVEFFDDPALAGTKFGPAEYATDAQGGTATFSTDKLYTTGGSNRWMKVAFEIPSVCLQGVQTTPLTGGPRLTFSAPLWVSRYDLGVFRSGTNALAGQDPLPDCYMDPNICSGQYGSYAELDFASNTQNGLAPGTSSGDQLMVEEVSGPANDQRNSVRPDGEPPYHLNFAIMDEALGPSSQDNARLAICITYYDDPALANAMFYPDAYQTDTYGQIVIKTPGAAGAVTLKGTDKWQQVYLEIPDMNFTGVNQGPQAAARFLLSDRIHFTNIKYAVIRPCGPTAGENLLTGCQQPVLSFGLNANIFRLSWPTNHVGYSLQYTTDLGSAQWTPVGTAPFVEGSLNVFTQAVSGNKFFRLAQ